MIFNFLKYLRPTWYFNLKPKVDYAYFPTEEILRKSGHAIEIDTGYKSKEAQYRDLAWRAFQLGFISEKPKEGIERERLLFAAYQLGIENNVKFAGKLPHAAVKKHLEQATIYLQYSIQEGFCNAVLEAQAMGLLCIVSDAEGLSENVLHNQTGWVVPKRSPELLAKKIKEVLLLSPTEKARIRTNATDRVQQEFNLEKQQLEFINFYSS